ncbi:tetratricopeptide repeat protein [Nocardia sp. NPDC127579]|uniref:tetratricopeptide repeat protein n=1 Tax=Nocardia sp. NPDC127579 TaxID=3345402 RepID=UPI00362FA6CC
MVSVEPLFGRLPAIVRGRAALVETLVDALVLGHARGRVRVLHGPGGCGKSTVALEVARQAHELGILTWRVDASTPSQLSLGMRQVAISLGIDDAKVRAAWSGLASAPDLLWRWLNGSQVPWLLVLDQADRPELLAAQHAAVGDGTGWLRAPAAPHGAVIVTSRDGSPRTWGPWAVRCAMDVLDPAEAARVLLDLAGSEAGSPADARRLAARLGYLPLALTLVGNDLKATLSGPTWPGDESLRTFDAYRQALAERVAVPRSASAGQKLVATISEVVSTSLSQIAYHGDTLARPLLWLLACFNDAVVPVEVLHPRKLADSTPFHGADGNAVREGLLELADRHLIELRRLEQAEARTPVFMVDLHPLIREVGLDQLRSAGQLSTYLGLLVEVMEYAVTEVSEQGEDGSRFDPFAHSTFLRWKRMVAHGTAALRLCPAADADHDTVARAARLAIFSARHLNAAGAYAQAVSVLEACHRIAVRILGPEHPHTIDARHQLGWSLRQQGRLDAAEVVYREVLELRRRVLGPEHPATLMAHHKLGNCWTDARRWDEAEAAYAEVYAARCRILGLEHPDTLRTRHGQAWLLEQRGHLAAAEQEYRAVLTARRRVEGIEHPDTLRTGHNLARVLKLRGRLDEAETEYQQVLASYRQMLGPDNPRSLATAADLAALYAEQGRVHAAIRLGNQVYQARRRVLGVEHPDTRAAEAAVAALTTVDMPPTVPFALGEREPDDD